MTTDDLGRLLGDDELRGIVHAAGVVDDGMLVDQTLPRAHSVMAPKVEGGRNVCRIGRELGADVVVFFSSMASVVGNAGQGPYAAANAYLDGFAEITETEQPRLVSINWGPWSVPGGMVSERAEEAWSAYGVDLLEAETALEVLGRVLESDRDRIAVADVDWQRFRDGIPGPPPAVLADVVPPRDEDADRERGAFRTELEETPVRLRRQRLVDEIRRLVADVLGHDGPDAVDPDKPYTDLGMDSLMAVQLRARLSRRLDVTVPSTVAFDYPSIERTADHLVEERLPELFEEADEEGIDPSESVITSESISVRESGAETSLGDLSDIEITEQLRQESEAILQDEDDGD